MKKLHLLLLGVTLCVFSACHNDIWDAIDGLDGRVTKLEELCKEMNTNITSLQTIVDVLQSNDFITSIVEIKKDGKVVGYTITFGKHDPITIYHGQDGKDGADGKDGQDGTNGKDGQDGADGKDGQNGADGKDGSTPVIGVAQDTDGVYYWTLNGEWLLDDNGNKLPVTGKDGKDGQDGADGKDGQNGTDGKDGQNGADGKDGQDGDSMFQSVTQDENYVYFTLADGTVIKIAKASEEHQPNSEFMFIVTYHANGGVGTMQPDTFYYGKIGEIKFCTFTKEGYCCTEWNTNPNGTGASYQGGFGLIIDRNIVLYAQWSKPIWSAVDLGLSVKWASMNIGATKPEDLGDYFAWGEITPKTLYSWSTYKWCNGSSSTLTKYTNTGYGTIDNKIYLEKADDVASMRWGSDWRMPTSDELTELYEECTWTWTTQNGMNGYKVTSNRNGNTIFLPASGYYNSNNLLVNIGSSGYYWSNSRNTSDSSNACALRFHSNLVEIGNGWNRCGGLSIRPVCP